MGKPLSELLKKCLNTSKEVRRNPVIFMGNIKPVSVYRNRLDFYVLKTLHAPQNDEEYIKYNGMLIAY